MKVGYELRLRELTDHMKGIKKLQILCVWSALQEDCAEFGSLKQRLPELLKSSPKGFGKRVNISTKPAKENVF